jgi:hypothetical protein
VFVSHAGSDTEWAAWVAWQLLADGFDVELDAWHWAPGDDFVERMSAALDATDVVVALWSAAYFDRARCTRDEWGPARAAQRRGTLRLVVFRVEDVAPGAGEGSLI